MVLLHISYIKNTNDDLPDNIIRYMLKHLEVLDAFVEFRATKADADNATKILDIIRNGGEYTRKLIVNNGAIYTTGVTLFSTLSQIDVDTFRIGLENTQNADQLTDILLDQILKSITSDWRLPFPTDVRQKLRILLQYY